MSVLGHICSPEGVDSEVLVEHHEEVAKPSFAEALVLEVGVMGVRWVGLQLPLAEVRPGRNDYLASSLPDFTTSDAIVCSGTSKSATVVPFGAWPLSCDASALLVSAAA